MFKFKVALFTRKYNYVAALGFDQATFLYIACYR